MDCVPEGADAGQPPEDTLPPTRLLRRASIALRGSVPTDAEYAALEAAGDDAAQGAFIDQFVDDTLQSPQFYAAMFESARMWMNIPLVPPTADEPEYGAQQQRVLTRCAADKAKAGEWVYYRGDGRACDGFRPDGTTPADERGIEPWWAPGTMVTLVGYAASTSSQGQAYNAGGNLVTIDCNGRPDGTCGCGPHAVRCHADFQTYPGWEHYVSWNEHGQRRQMAEEPARFLAHLVWHDQPLTDLVTSTRSVGTVNLQAAYVMQGIEGGHTELVDDDSWWNPARYSGARVDPLHDADDPEAWREYEQPARNPFFLVERDYHYDPRTDPMPARGIPAAGALTSLGFLNGYPRERLRAARALETFACEVLAPPSGQTFNPYQRDPASEGPCQHCHRRVDPAGIHFKRWAKAGNAFEGYGASFFMPGVGSVWHWPAVWTTGEWPYTGVPFTHWRRWYSPDTRMTPVTVAEAMANPEAVFIDFLPPDQTLLGQVSDGTVGPLGFAKIIVASGAFDRCMVRRIHEFVVGRDIDPGAEAGYLDELTMQFVDGGRLARPLIKRLTQSAIFRRGF